MSFMHQTKSLLRILLGVALCIGSLNIFQVSVWCDLCDDYAKSINVVSKKGEHPCPMCLDIHNECRSQKKLPSTPHPEQKQFQLDAFNHIESATAKPHPTASKQSSFFGYITLLTAQTIYLEVQFTPPDLSLIS